MGAFVALILSFNRKSGSPHPNRRAVQLPITPPITKRSIAILAMGRGKGGEARRSRTSHKPQPCCGGIGDRNLGLLSLAAVASQEIGGVDSYAAYFILRRVALCPIAEVSVVTVHASICQALAVLQRLKRVRAGRRKPSIGKALRVRCLTKKGTVIAGRVIAGRTYCQLCITSRVIIHSKSIAARPRPVSPTPPNRKAPASSQY